MVLPRLDERFPGVKQLTARLAEVLAGAECQDRRKGSIAADYLVSAKVVILPILRFSTSDTAHFDWPHQFELIKMGFKDL